MEFGFIDLVRNFRQFRQFWDLKTWTQVRKCTVILSKCDYILGKDRCRFELFRIQDMRNYKSNHFAIWARLLRRPTRCHTRYFQGRIAFPLKLPPAV